MKVIVLNDTSKYHHGCYKVMEYLHNDLSSNGHHVLAYVGGNTDRLPNDPSYYENADAVIINGEGTMHHDRPLPHSLLNVLRNAKKKGMKTALINTVWQSMTLDTEMKEVLKDTYISVREIKSQRELQKDGIESDIHLDLSYFNDVPEVTLPNKEYVVGKFFFQSDFRPRGVPSLDIFKDKWNKIVNTLRTTDWFITGRHHELYAACKARCPFSVLSGNTWKNHGLIETAGVDILIGDPHMRHEHISRFVDKCKERRMEYEKLFNWMELQPKFTVKGKLE